MIRVVEAFRHPSYRIYSHLTVTHDVALLKLEVPSKIKPARLAAADGSNNKPGSMATTLGWGLINNETFSDVLKTVDVEIITNAKCAQKYANVNESTIVDDSVICAGNGNGKDSCNGDSGGPLLVNDVLVGIVSAGLDVCGILPGSYARVSYALEFINEILGGKTTGDITELLTAGTSILFDTNAAQDAK